jgi:hypothetical protein
MYLRYSTASLTAFTIFFDGIVADDGRMDSEAGFSGPGMAFGLPE